MVAPLLKVSNQIHHKQHNSKQNSPGQGDHETAHAFYEPVFGGLFFVRQGLWLPLDISVVKDSTICSYLSALASCSVFCESIHSIGRRAFVLFESG